MKSKLLTALTAVVLMAALAVTPAMATVNGIFIGSDEDGVNILNDLLRPGNEYYFPILVAIDGTRPVNLTAADLERGSMTVRPSNGGSAVSEAEITEREGLVCLRIIPGELGTDQTHEVTLRVNYRSKDGQNVTVLPKLRIGYTTMSDERLSLLDPGEPLEPDPQNPIIMPSQWRKLSELNDFQPVTLIGADWRYTVNVSNLGKRNLLSEHRPNMELVREYPNAKLHFIGFPGTPDFEVKGKLTLDVSEIAEEFGGEFFLYRSAFGKLYPLAFDYDDEAAEITFRPSLLGNYVISDRKLDSTANSGGSESESSRPSNGSGDEQNPETGHSQSIIAYIVSLVSIAGLGAIGCSKRIP